MSATTHVVRAAASADIEPIMYLLDECIEWLADRGIDQWQRGPGRQRPHLETDRAEGTLFVVEDHVGMVATITVDRFADADFWCADDDITAALYAHPMAVARRAAGVGLGSAMLDWAAERVERLGRKWLRLDAWSTNGLLHAYYKNLGFEMVRNVPVPGRGSGALFERAAGDRHGGGPVLADLTDLPTGRVL